MLWTVDVEAIVTTSSPGDYYKSTRTDMRIHENSNFTNGSTSGVNMNTDNATTSFGNVFNV